MTIPAVRFSGITRRFPGVTALSDVSFDVASATCHAICGENGAGKSTLGKVLAGIEVPDSGTIELSGLPEHFPRPRDARTAGIVMVHQELAFCANLTVAENLCLARLPHQRMFLDRAALHQRASELLAAVGAEIDPSLEMDRLSVAEQQLVQIAGAAGANARVIIFDEPTSSLGDREAERLYEVVKALKARGVTLIYVSHRLNEIFHLCDRVTVLRDGVHVATKEIGELSEASLVELMIGRRLEPFAPSHLEAGAGGTALEVRHLTSGRRVRDVSFEVRKGEVVGVAGLVGAGRSEIANALFGLDRVATGSITVGGAACTIRSPQDAMAAGIGYVPEDRKRLGLVLSLVNRENATLPVIHRMAKGGWVLDDMEGHVTGDVFSRVRMSAGHEVATNTLSGGNQQKVVIAKWLAARSEILILDEPTRGIDVAAKAELHAWIDRLAAGGGAVLLISSEMPELLSLSSRIIVLREGRIVGELSRAEATQERVLRMMSGLAAA